MLPEDRFGFWRDTRTPWRLRSAATSAGHRRGGDAGRPWSSLPPPSGGRDSAAQEGVAQEGVAQEGVAQEGVAQEGVAQEGVAQEGAAGA